MLPYRRSFLESFAETLGESSVMGLLGWSRDPQEQLRQELERRSGVQMLAPALQVGTE